MDKYRIIWVEPSGLTHFAYASNKSEARRVEKSIVNRYGDSVDYSYIELMEEKTYEKSTICSKV